jgi:hypothetical protein
VPGSRPADLLDVGAVRQSAARDEEALALRKGLGVGGVEDLGARLVVTVERRNRAAAGPQAEVVVVSGR